VRPPRYLAVGGGDSKVHRKHVLAHGLDPKNTGLWMVLLVSPQQAVRLDARQRPLRAASFHKRPPHPPSRCLDGAPRDGRRRLLPLIVNRQKAAVDFRSRRYLCRPIEAD
jgi:hypothetical protein